MNSPLALYCFITSTVPAGAVALARDPKISPMGILLRINALAIPTRKKAPKASKITMRIIDFPSFQISLNLSSPPIPNPINERTTRFTISKDLI